MKKLLMIIGLTALILQAQADETNTTSANSAPGSSSKYVGFTVDGLRSGTHLNDILKAKFKKREDGQYSVLQGSTDFASEMIYGKEQSGDFLAYETEILGKKATVYLWLTSKTKRLYTARVEWDNLGMNSFKGFIGSIDDALDKKYGSGKSEKKENSKDMFLPGRVWMPNEYVKITHRMSMGQGYSIGAYINYLDLKLQKQNKEEETTLTSSTHKL